MALEKEQRTNSINQTIEKLPQDLEACVNRNETTAAQRILYLAQFQEKLTDLERRKLYLGPSYNRFPLTISVGETNARPCVALKRR